jgi:hypothetical protein
MPLTSDKSRAVLGTEETLLQDFGPANLLISTPVLAELLVVSALVGVVWAVVKAVWTCAILRQGHRDELARQASMRGRPNPSSA